MTQTKLLSVPRKKLKEAGSNDIFGLGRDKRTNKQTNKQTNDLPTTSTDHQLTSH